MSITKKEEHNHTGLELNLMVNVHQPRGVTVAKMASHAIFQYNVLAIDDTHNTWINVIVKMTILRLLGSSDDKEKRGVARPEGPPLRGFRYPVSGQGSRGSRPSQVSGQRPENSSDQEHRKNRCQGHRCTRRLSEEPTL